MTGTFRWNVGLLFVIGLVSTIGFKLWQMIKPYTQPPPRPEFKTTVKPKPQAKPAPTPSPAPTTPPKEPETPPIGMGRVVPDIGLVLRDEPSGEAGGSSGVGFNAEVAILEESTDGEWLKIRDEGTGATGWVRSANIDRVSQ